MSNKRMKLGNDSTTVDFQTNGNVIVGAPVYGEELPTSGEEGLVFYKTDESAESSSSWIVDEETGYSITSTSNLTTPALNIKEGGAGAAFFGDAQEDGVFEVNGFVRPKNGLVMENRVLAVYPDAGKNAVPDKALIRSEGYVSGQIWTGWIRVAKMDLNSNNHIGGQELDIYFHRQYNSPAPESYHIVLNIGWTSSASMYQLSGHAGGRAVTEFRFAVDTSAHVAYIELYAAKAYATYENLAFVEIEQRGAFASIWTPIWELAGANDTTYCSVNTSDGTVLPRLVLDNHSSPIGTEVMGSGSVSATNDVWYRAASVTLTAGVWVIFGYVSRNTTTNQFACVLEENGNGNITRQTQIDGGVYIHSSKVWALTEDTTIYVRCWQNSGSTLTVGGYVHAVRIA